MGSNKLPLFVVTKSSIRHLKRSADAVEESGTSEGVLQPEMAVDGQETEGDRTENDCGNGKRSVADEFAAPPPKLKKNQANDFPHQSIDYQREHLELMRSHTASRATIASELSMMRQAYCIVNNIQLAEQPECSGTPQSQVIYYQSSLDFGCKKLQKYRILASVIATSHTSIVSYHLPARRDLCRYDPMSAFPERTYKPGDKVKNSIIFINHPE